MLFEKSSLAFDVRECALEARRDIGINVQALAIRSKMDIEYPCAIENQSFP